MLQSPQFTKIISMPQLYQHIMEGLFIHFFPDTDDSKVVYSKEDIEFFLTFANEQHKWKGHAQKFHQDDRSKNLISFSKFKFHLDRILCKGWSESGPTAKPLNCYKLEVKDSKMLMSTYILLVQVCICVGETILRYFPEATQSKYTPSYLHQTTTDNKVRNPVFVYLLCWLFYHIQQILMHLYFYTVLEKLQISQFTPSLLVKMVTDTDKVKLPIIILCKALYTE